jgi:Uma2 family endonuclease
MSSRPSGKAVAADLLGLPEELGAEIVDGEIVQKAAPDFEHGNAQLGLGAILRGPFQRRPGGPGGPGGWWLGSEVDIEFEVHEVYCPDLAGWRRDHCPQRPTGRPVRIRPDWVCEVLSRSTASRDQVKKLRTYLRCGVGHYWIVAPEHETLTVMRNGPDGFVVVLTAARPDRVRAEPFEAIEIHVGLLFGDDPED